MKKRVAHRSVAMWMILLLLLTAALATFGGLAAFAAENGTTGAVFVGLSDGMSTKELYDATNTYPYNGDNKNNCTMDVAVSPTVAENKAYREYVYYNIDPDSRNSERVGDKVQITVLTHGLGGSAAHWSNTNEVTYLADKEISAPFAYDSESLITVLANATDAQVYWAKMKGHNSFRLMNLQNANYRNEDGSYKDPESVQTVTEIADISKHIILVFEATEDGTNGYNNYIYEELNYMLGKIVYDVKMLNGGILPKINLIGHSRGGITNWQYALDHPDMVASVFSMGTPYFGSDTASTSLGASFCAGAEWGHADIIGRSIYIGYYTRWQNNRDMYRNIKVHALGGYSDSDFVFDAILAKPAVLEESDVNAAFIRKLKKGLRNFHLTTTVASVASKHIHKWLHSTGCEDGNVENWLQIISDMRYTDKNSSFGSNLKHLLPFVGCPYFMNDLLVDLPSQLGYEKHSSIQADYGFITYKRKFKEKDYKKNERKVSDTSMPAIVHNLEARDKKLIQYIRQNITMGMGKNEWLYELQADGTATLNGYTGRMSENGVFTVPDTVDGHTVRAIGDSAFEEISARENITQLYLPNTLRRVGARAFAECDSVQTVYFEPYVDDSEYTTIGEECFAGCTKLTEVRMSDTVRHIDDYAFNGCVSLTSITLGGRLTDVCHGIFLGCTKLAAIDVDAGNLQYKAENGVLLSYDGTRLIEYPKAKADVEYTVPDSVRTIDTDAFYGNTHLRSVHLNKAERIGQAAFYDCTALSQIAGNAVEFVAHGAFEGTAWLDDSENEDIEKLYAVGKTLVRYSGNKTETEISAYETIAPYAFAGNTALNGVTLSGNVLRCVGESAFAECLSLSRVSITNMSQAVNGSADMFSGADDTLKIYVPDAMLSHYTAANGWSEYASVLEPATVTVSFYTCGGENLEPVTVKFGERYSLPTPQKPGCVFIGWYDNPNYTGAEIPYVTPDSLQDISLYARWANETYTVTLDFNGQTLGKQSPTLPADWSETVSVNYGMSFVLPVPSCEGFAFDGWANGDVTVTDNEGYSIVPFTYEQDVTLLAKWHREFVTFWCEVPEGKPQTWKFDFDTDMDLSQYSPNDLFEQLHTNKDENFMNFIYRPGYKYRNLTIDPDGKLVASRLTESMIDENGRILLYPQYDAEKYTLVFAVTAQDLRQIELGIHSTIKYPTPMSGYTERWFNISTNEEFTLTELPDLTSAEEDVTITLRVERTPIVYSIAYHILDKTDTNEAVDTNRVTLINHVYAYQIGDSVVLPAIESHYYELIGWYVDETCSQAVAGISTGEYGDRTFYAKLKIRIYTVRFAVNGGTPCAPISVKYGSTIILPSTTVAGYDGTWQYWGYLTGDGRKSNFGCAYTVTENSTMTVAWWKRYNITYTNLQYQGKTATLRNTEGGEVPTYYHFFSSDSHLLAADLNNVVAEMPYGTTVFHFLGWYKEATFNTKVPCIGEWETGDITLYAKWRCDYSLFSREEPYRITDNYHTKQKHDIIYYGYKLNPSALSDLRALGMKHLVLDIRILMREIDSGYQRLWLYADDSVLLWNTQFEYGGSQKVTTLGIVQFTVTISLDTLQNFDSLYLRYSAAGKGDDDWENNKLTIERMAVVDPKDANYPTYCDRGKNFLV